MAKRKREEGWAIVNNLGGLIHDTVSVSQDEAKTKIARILFTHTWAQLSRQRYRCVKVAISYEVPR